MQDFIVFMLLADFIEFAKMFPCKCFNTAPAKEGEFKFETLTSTGIATKTKRLVRKFRFEDELQYPIVKLTFTFGVKVHHSTFGIRIVAEPATRPYQKSLTAYKSERPTVSGLIISKNQTVTVPAINIRLKGFAQEKFVVEKLFIFPLDNTYGK